jgi:hypothetical protein
LPSPPPSPPRSEPSAPKPVRSKPPASDRAGYLTVNSVPWGAVFINGKQIAPQTPAYKLEVAPGKYEVKIYNPARKSFSPPQRVTIAPGAVRVLGFQW